MTLAEKPTEAARGRTITIDPITRIEGHMRVEAVVDAGEVKDARCCGTMFRGFERILIGRHPLDASRIAQRVCGVCPTAHASAASGCLDAALGIADKIPDNARLVRNLIFGSNYLQSHILHFFTLAALDYVDVATAADSAGGDTGLKTVRAFIGRGELGPFFPRYEGDYRCSKDENLLLLRGYLQALGIRRLTHEMLAIFGGKMPHNVGIVPGGVTEQVTADRIAMLSGKLAEVAAFVEDVYLPAVMLVAGRYEDHLGVGVGCGRFLSYGVFNEDGASTDPLRRRRAFPSGLLQADGTLEDVDGGKIAEDVARSRYADECSARPAKGQTIPEPHKDGAYTWLKAPRYDGAPAEVGPLARVMVGYARGDERIRADVDAAAAAAGIELSQANSVLGRHLARALEARWVCDLMSDWLDQLTPGAPVSVPLTIPDEGDGAGLTGAPRGSLGHWIQIREGKIARYQMVVPTTWNGSPRDADCVPGPMEQALIGTKVKDPDNPFEVVRTVRSFDPCLACSVHVLTARGQRRGVYRIV